MIKPNKIPLVAACAAAFLTFATAASAADSTYKVNIRALNQSGVSGSGTLTLNGAGTQLTVTIDATGFEPHQVHVGHIHGLIVSGNTPADSSIPSRQQDSDKDRFVELEEGQVTYGPILITLGTDNGGNLDPDGDGTVHYSQTFNLDDPAIYGAGFNKASVVGSGNALELREIIVHGLTVPTGPGGGTPGEVNGTNGYLTVLPVGGGEIKGVTGDALRFRMAPHSH